MKADQIESERERRYETPTESRRRLIRTAILGVPLIVAGSAQTAHASNGGTNTSAGTNP